MARAYSQGDPSAERVGPPQEMLCSAATQTAPGHGKPLVVSIGERWRKAPVRCFGHPLTHCDLSGPPARARLSWHRTPHQFRVNSWFLSTDPDYAPESIQDPK